MKFEIMDDVILVSTKNIMEHVAIDEDTGDRTNISFKAGMTGYVVDTNVNGNKDFISVMLDFPPIHLVIIPKNCLKKLRGV